MRSPIGRATLTPNSTAPVLRRRIVPVAHRLLVGREQRRAVGARGEQHPALGIEHGIGIEAVAGGIERPHFGRDVERERRRRAAA